MKIHIPTKKHGEQKKGNYKDTTKTNIKITMQIRNKPNTMKNTQT